MDQSTKIPEEVRDDIKCPHCGGGEFLRAYGLQLSNLSTWLQQSGPYWVCLSCHQALTIRNKVEDGKEK